VARNQVEVGVRNGSEEQRFARFQFRDLDFVSIVVDLDDVADRALWGAIGPMLIAPETTGPYLRAPLALLADLVRDAGGGPVADSCPGVASEALA
jgi:hypothetical protein